MLDAMSTNFNLIMSNLKLPHLLRVSITLILGISRGMPHYRNQGRSAKVNLASSVLTICREYSPKDKGRPIARAETRTAEIFNFQKI